MLCGVAETQGTESLVTQGWLLSSGGVGRGQEGRERGKKLEGKDEADSKGPLLTSFREQEQRGPVGKGASRRLSCAI